MKLAICQTNPIIGNFDYNSKAILEAVKSLISQKPDLVVFPEMALCGYPPLDLLDLDSFEKQDKKAFAFLENELPKDIAVAIGHICKNNSGVGKPLINKVSVVLGGKVVFEQAKTLLPSYDVFDETRYFEPAKERKVWDYCGKKVAFLVCEDLWCEKEPMPGMRYSDNPPKDLIKQGANLFIVPSASPFERNKIDVRVGLCRRLAEKYSVPVAYCNVCGANDSLVFDGRSFFIGKDGKVEVIAGFEEQNLVIDTEVSCASSPYSFVENDSFELEQALVIGIRDYMKKCGFKKCVLGLSGGIDSALVAVLAVKAVGAENVTCITMPSRFSSSGSVDDSVELAKNLGCRLENIPIEGVFKSGLDSLEPFFNNMPFDVAEENMQARIRGLILMTWSNKFNAMLLATGNKSELSVGYCTMYGDMCGALAVIGDLFKTEVFELCRYINSVKYTIPEAIINKAPSAELRPDQKDQDSLPPYDVLDKILRLYIEKDLSATEIASLGFDLDLCKKILKMTARTEFKRRQAAVVIKISPRAFGSGRRIPIARSVFEAN